MELAVAVVLLAGLVLLVAVVDILAKAGREEPGPADFEILPIVVFPDFASVEDIEVKKQQFFDFLQDYVYEENQKLRALRVELRHYARLAADNVPLSAIEEDRLRQIAEQFRLEMSEYSLAGLVAELDLRIDVIPVSLVLAQAANESAWGTSRFTLQGNNIFGQWCYEEGCGIVPRRRAAGATHEVRRFDTIDEAVAAYFVNINTNPVYQYLRELRAEMRSRDMRLNSLVLAFGLGRYSERGGNYIDEVQNIIVQNDLLSRDGIQPPV